MQRLLTYPARKLGVGFFLVCAVMGCAMLSLDGLWDLGGGMLISLGFMATLVGLREEDDRQRQQITQRRLTQSRFAQLVEGVALNSELAGSLRQQAAHTTDVQRVNALLNDARERTAARNQQMFDLHDWFATQGGKDGEETDISGDAEGTE